MVARNRGRDRGGRGDGMAVEDGPKSASLVPMVEVRNWEAGTMADVVAFLERKMQVRLQNPRQTGALVVAQIQPQETTRVEKWSGVRFAGNALSIRVVQKPAEQSATTSATFNLLTQVLQTRYNPQLKLLNLAGLMSDPMLLQAGLLANPQTAMKMFKALLKIASDTLGDVESVSLEGNMIANVDFVTELASFFPHLLNLSLSNNQITGMASMLKLRNKLPLLRELVLTGNPLQQNPAYQSQAQEIVKLFPRLVVLDGVPVRSEADLPRNTLPAPIVPNFFEDEGVAGLTPQFLLHFFSFWDSDRSSLISLYDDASLFSLSLDMTAPHQARSNMNQYTQLSRNLVRNSGQHSRHHRIFLGPAAIAGAFNKVPTSKHDLTNAQAFATDSWKVNGVRQPGDTAVIIVVHGEFEERTNAKTANNSKWKTLRSFDRTLVVLPGPNMNYVIASDLLEIRFHSTLPHSKQTTGIPQAQATPAASVAPVDAVGANAMGANAVPNAVPNAMGANAPAPAGPGVAPVSGAPPVGAPGAPNVSSGIPPGVPPLHQEFMRQTGLTAEYAEMCLKQANYDPNVAFQLFQQSRAQLPPNAFIQR